MKELRRLPSRRLDDCKREKVRIGPGSTVQIQHNTYSVHSRLISEWVQARVYAEKIEIWYAQRKVDTLPRLRGEKKHKIQYRHIIDWLIRKPGAFEDYRYREDLFPSSYFRMAYDYLREKHSKAVAAKEYLKILHLAAKESEAGVEAALKESFSKAGEINVAVIRERICSGGDVCFFKDIAVPEPDLATYDLLLENVMEVAANG
jgi:hypothetical protein